MSKAKIDRMQYFFMIPNLIFGKAIGVTSGIITRKIGGDTWTAMSIGFVAGITMLLIMTYLCSKFPDKTVIQFSEDLLGKWGGKSIGLVLAVFFIFAFGASANTMTLHLNEYFLTSTPFFLICLLYILLCMYGVFLGVEVIIRFSLVGFIMALLINLSMVTGTIQDFKLYNLLPLMDKGLSANIAGSVFLFGDTSMAILAAGFLFPMLDKKKSVMPITFWAMFIGASIVVIWPMFETAVMGTEMMRQYVIVCMQQIRCAQLTRYFPRYELIMVSFFTFTMFVQSATMFYCAKYCVKQITGLKKDVVIIIPLTAILLIITYFMGRDDNNYINFLAFPYSQLCASLSIGLPFILLLAALIRGKLKQHNQHKEFNA